MGAETVRVTKADVNEVVNRVMNEVVPTNWNNPIYADARAAFLDEMAWRVEREWQVDALVDAWVWFRIGYQGGHHAGWMKALPL